MKKQQRKTARDIATSPPVNEALLAHDAAIIFVDTSGRPAITVRPSQEFATFEAGTRSNMSSSTLARFGGVLQAVPTLFTASEVHGRQLMEVVVNGDLVRAADGNGFRAIVMGPKGIQEHARLFTPEKLQNVVSAGAVWQIASVVVAQKHLADISKKLDTISKDVSNISNFLDEARRSRIEGAYSYLRQVMIALKGGEMPASVRGELEGCERDLLSINAHIYKQLIARFADTVQHAEMVGTEELALNISRKMREQEPLLQDFALGIQTRICAWHVLSLFPGEPVLKEARRVDLQRAVDNFRTLAQKFDGQLNREINAISSTFNSEATLERRRAGLRKQLTQTVAKMRDTQTAVNKNIDDTAGLLVEHDSPTRLLFHYRDGALEQISQIETK